MRRATFAIALLCGNTAVVACGKTKVVAPGAGTPVLVSNVTRADYAGSDACATCHADLYERWMKTPMHGMTRRIETAHVDAPFDGTVFHFKRDFATLETHDGRRYVRLDAAEKGQSVLYRVTKVIGGRHREDFAGVEVESTAADAEPKGADKILPVSFMRGTRQLRYKGYSVMEKERPGLRASGEWRRRCIFCHNTEPYLDVILDGLAADDAKPYQGVVVDALLPKERRATYRITNDEAFVDALHAEIHTLDASDAVAVARSKTTAIAIDRATTSIRARFDEKNLLEIGIGCESCHNGSKAHADDPRVRPSFWPTAPWLSVKPPAGTDDKAQSISRACARCHQVLFSAYPFTWEGGLRANAPGGSSINSGEARDFLLGGCASKLACTACHDPHDPKGVARADDAICTRCHDEYAAPEAHRAHAHHDPNGAGGACVACHMPKKNLGLDGRLVRYHRIGSPNDKTRVEHDRPLECALCHAQKTVAELVSSLEAWWGRSYDRKALVALYGPLEGSAVLATLDRGKPHEQGLAIAIAGEARLRPAVPYLVTHATHEVPLLRYWTLDALARIFEATPDVDLHRDNGEIRKKVRAWVGSRGFVLP